MPFDSDTKARMFVRSARICCLCFKPCGTNIEAAHIIAEADGGSNKDENGIPLCFDCHQEIGAYDKRHPKGNTFTEAELKARRDQVYKLVEDGILQAQIATARIQSSWGAKVSALSSTEIGQVLRVSTGPSDEARAVLSAALEEQTPESLPIKLGLLSDDDQAHVLDTLLKRSFEEGPMTALISILPKYAESEQMVLLEQILRKVTLAGNPRSKAHFMDVVPVEALARTETGLRSAFFMDVIGIIERDQFTEVNAVTPAAIKVQTAIPRELLPLYAKALFSQAASGAWRGGPAARSALRSLPPEIVQVALKLLDRKALWINYNDLVKDFLGRYKHMWESDQTQMFEDYLRLGRFEFGAKYFKDNDSYVFAE